MTCWLTFYLRPDFPCAHSLTSKKNIFFFRGENDLIELWKKNNKPLFGVVDGFDNVFCESLFANVRLTDGCWGLVVSLPILLERDVNAHEVQEVSLAVVPTLLEVTSFSKRDEFDV